LVIYESRLELARLLFADFDRSVQRILAQPFLLCFEVAGAQRKHVPDYLLLTSSGPLVVDVKLWQRATKPDNLSVFRMQLTPLGQQVIAAIKGLGRED
jgi:hypothetical protein